MKNEKYAVVTAISTHRMRYVISMDELQKLNPEKIVQLGWAEDCVVCEEIKEFSQLHLGELIVDTVEMSEEDVLEVFDLENDYLSAWPTEKKLERIRDWRFQSAL